MPNIYDHPEIYDAVNAAGTMAEARSLVAIAQTLGSRGSLSTRPWLEPGSGSGRIQFALAKLNISTVGVDLSPAMIEFARTRAQKLRLTKRVQSIVGDMRSLHAAIKDLRLKDRFSVSYCLDNSIRHLASDRDMLTHFASLTRVLDPKGFYIIGIGLLPETGEFPSDDIRTARIGNRQIHQLIEFLPPLPNSGLRGIAARQEWAYGTTSITSPSGVDILTSRYPLRTYTLKQWRSLLKRSSMHEIAIVDERGRSLDPERTNYAFRVLTPARQ